MHLDERTDCLVGSIPKSSALPVPFPHPIGHTREIAARFPRKGMRGFLRYRPSRNAPSKALLA
jgi:hypothetical protein